MERKNLPREIQQIYSGKYQIVEGVGAPEAIIKPTPGVETKFVHTPRLRNALTEGLAK